MFEDSESTVLLLPLIGATNRTEFVLALEHADLGDVPTLLHQLEDHRRHFAQIVHRLPQAVLTARPDGRFDYASRQWIDATGDREAALHVHESVQRACAWDVAAFDRRWREAIESNEPFIFEVPLRTVRGVRRHELRANPWFEEQKLRKWIVSVEDVDDNTAARARLNAYREHLAVLAEVGGAALEPNLSEEELVRRVLAASARIVTKVWIATLNVDGRDVVIAQPNGARLFERWFERTAAPNGPSASVESWNGERGRPVLRVPLRLPGRNGQIAVVGEPGDSAFSEDALNVVRDVAYRLASALQNARDIARENRIAQVLQMAILSAVLPQAQGVSFDVAYRAAQTRPLIGGDWYDAFELRDGRVAFSIGDVCGQGLDAAVIMGRVREMLRVSALEGSSASDALAATNASIVADDQGLITAFLAYLDPFTLALEFASAGHCPPRLVNLRGEVVELSTGDVLLGATAAASYSMHTRQLDEGDAIVLYTDGLTKCSRDPVAGERALGDALGTWGARGFDSNAETLLNAVVKEAALDDDAALLVMRTQAVDQLDHSFSSNVVNARRARAWMERSLSRSLLRTRTGDFVLAMSEAVNNAIEHGSGSSNDSFRVAVDWDDGEVRGLVESTGPWQEHESTLERGRGLTLMRALTDRVAITVGTRGTCVRLFATLGAPCPAAQIP